MPRSCTFCGDDSCALTAEHVFPAWIGRLLKSCGYGPFSLDGTGPDGTQRAFVDNDMPMRVRAVCQSCNNGWMSELETLAEPILSRLIVGESATLSLDEQLTVGVWATKTAMMCEQVGLSSRQFFTAAERRRMAEGVEITPHNRSVIWLAAYEGDLVAVAEVVDVQGVVNDEITETRGAIFTVVIGALIIQMLCHRAGDDLREPHVVNLPMRAGAWAQATVPIWPIGDHEVRWPPLCLFDDKTLPN